MLSRKPDPNGPRASHRKRTWCLAKWPTATQPLADLLCLDPGFLSQLSIPRAHLLLLHSPGFSVSQRSHRSQRPQPFKRDQREGQLSATRSTSTCHLHPNGETGPLYPGTRERTHTPRAAGGWSELKLGPCLLAILVVRRCKGPCKLACFFKASFHLPQTRKARVLPIPAAGTVSAYTKFGEANQETKNPPEASALILPAQTRQQMSLCEEARQPALKLRLEGLEGAPGTQTPAREL